MADLNLDCYLGGTTSGLCVSAGQYVNGYDLHADTRASKQVTWRKQTISSSWVEGDYDASAVRGNVTEVVAIWVYGNDNNEYRSRVNAIIPYLSQASWKILWTLDGGQELWDCTFSDYSEETQREFQYARQGVVRMNVMRRPRVTYTDATGLVTVL